jgi:RNA polymerase sigma-70 factor (ECF subfamily)
MAETTDELIPTRATLILRLKDWQDQASWQDFFDTYWKLIHGVAVKGGLTPAEAQDVVQEIMIAVAKQIPTFQYDPSIGSFKGWLLNMTRWRIADQIRRRNKELLDVLPDIRQDEETQVINRQADPFIQNLDDLWNEEWEKNLLAAAITKVKRKLDPLKYQIFDFYVNKGWPPGKVADAFEVPVEQVYMIKHRVTDLIKAEVKRLEKEMR